jgi:hypothetical protein
LIILGVTLVETVIVFAIVYMQPKPEIPTTPDELENRKPLVWDAQENHDWLYDMPYKADMRQMWVKCNRIVAAGRGDKQPTYDEIWTASGDIARRSNKNARLWEAAVEKYEALLEDAEYAREGDWMTFLPDLKEAWNTCNDCHMAAWSPYFQHVNVGVIETWNQNRLQHKGHSMKMTDPPPSTKNREVMKELQAAFDKIDKCFLEKGGANVDKNIDAMVEGCNAIIKVAKERAQYWRTISDNATAIRTAADNKDVDAIKAAYGVMTAQCKSCHAVNVGEVRDVMTPMTWDK